MKVLITGQPPKTKTDYLVISPENGDNFFELDKFLDHNECSQITFDLIDYVPTAKLSSMIAALSTKLAHKGQLCVCGTDVATITQHYQNGRINILEFNELIFGKRDAVWSFKQALVALNDVVAIFQANNLKVLQKRLSDFTFAVTGERE